MSENLKEFIKAISPNEEESKIVRELKTREEVIEFAKDKGFTLTDEDFEDENFENAQPEGELSDDELDAVAGGAGGKCACFVGGGGGGGVVEALKCNHSGDMVSYGHYDACACVAGGGGEWSNGDCRCACVAIGYGNTD